MILDFQRAFPPPYQLNLGDVLLPLQILVDSLRFKGSQSIIRVHEQVYEGVHQSCLESYNKRNGEKLIISLASQLTGIPYLIHWEPIPIQYDLIATWTHDDRHAGR